MADGDFSQDEVEVRGTADKMTQWRYISNSGERVLIVSRRLLGCNNKQRDNERSLRVLENIKKQKDESIFSGRNEKRKHDSERKMFNKSSLNRFLVHILDLTF